ncbi:MAG: hypothetical protein RLP15_09985 [Cryomorphaceae bacterium]
MRAPVYKFLAFSLVILLAMSGMNSDSRLYCPDASASYTADRVDTEQVIQLAEQNLKENRGTKDDSKGFKFPNVFDALRFIF